jgi:hypothetical protein
MGGALEVPIWLPGTASSGVDYTVVSANAIWYQ